MNTPRHRFVARVLIALSTLMVLSVLAVAPLAGTSMAQSRRSQAPEADRGQALEELSRRLVGRIEARPRSVSGVINAYNDVEARRLFDVAGRYRLHRALLDALKAVDEPALGRLASRLLRSPSRRQFAAQVLLMKALLGEKFPLAREERVELLLRVARGRHLPLAIWGLRLAGESGWPEAVDALIAAMDDEEANGRSGGMLWQLISAELYRIFGGRTGYATAPAIRAEWERRGKRVPETPDYGLPDASDHPARTAVFFGDRISPRAVFLIDVSGSMQREVTVRPGQPAPSSKTVVEKPGWLERRGVRRAKIEIVKSELERAIAGLEPASQFNVLKYSEMYAPWKSMKGELELVTANASNVASATAFTRELKSESGTNIYATLDAALRIPELDTIYLLSDGAPSVGGGVDDIERNVRHLNYLKGVRIVTYGFAPETRGLFDERHLFDEPFMQRLAAENWGWYRRLNQKPPAQDAERAEK